MTEPTLLEVGNRELLLYLFMSTNGPETKKKQFTSEDLTFFISDLLIHKTCSYGLRDNKMNQYVQ